MRDALNILDAGTTSVPNTTNTFTDFANVIDLGPIDSGSRFSFQHPGVGAEEPPYLCIMANQTTNWSVTTDGFVLFLKTNASSTIGNATTIVASSHETVAAGAGLACFTAIKAGYVYKLAIPDANLLEYLSAGVYVGTANTGGPYTFFCWIETGANQVL